MKLKNVKLRLRSVKRLLFLILKICLVFGSNAVAQNRIVIDPGHGGKDWGTFSQNGTSEKEVVMDIAKQIVIMNRELFDDSLEIYLTRYTDTLIALEDRSQLAKTLNADIFISLHCNHSEKPDARGVEVYVAKSKNAFSDQSTWLGYELQKRFKEQLGFKSRGVKFGNFQVLRETSATMPSVLVELGFLSNSDENDYYQNSTSYRALALVILECLIKNFSGYERVGD